MGHYASEMGGRTTETEMAEDRYEKKKEALKKIARLVKNPPFKISSFKRGTKVKLRKSIDEWDVHYAYGLSLDVHGTAGALKYGSAKVLKEDKNNPGILIVLIRTYSLYKALGRHRYPYDTWKISLPFGILEPIENKK